MKLLYHDYKYYPYERYLALREAAALLGTHAVRELSNGIELAGGTDTEIAHRLVYFSQVHHERVTNETIQSRLERAATIGRRRQATRYSVHGLHEYKGKFNPQIAKAILNIFGISAGDHVLDPFCGSGTSLVECAQIGAKATGFDLNPFAVYVANAKLLALTIPFVEIQEYVDKVERSLSRAKKTSVRVNNDARSEYLSKWFDKNILSQVEWVRLEVEKVAETRAPILLCVASNLLRDYSLQDPNDLRIRRRTSPLPSVPFAEAFLAACKSFCRRLAETQSVLGSNFSLGRAHLCSSTSLNNIEPMARFDAGLTSPPYAMALPYIDTQRLSLVWLGLSKPNEILSLEADLVGSREMRGGTRRELAERLKDNAEEIPEEQFKFCKKLARQLGSKDGFRRKAVPPLLYRYFSEMQKSFQGLRNQLKPNAPYALIVGHNHTVLNGVRRDIDTPRHLAGLAQSAGWSVEELIPLQTYQRFGYHMDNAVSSETLVLLRNK